MKNSLLRFVSDERGDLTVEMVVVIGAVVILCISVFILIMPSYHDTRDYSVAMLDFDQSGVENPECRYVKGYQSAPNVTDSNGQIIASCAELYELQRHDIDPLDPQLTTAQAFELLRLYRSGIDFQDLEVFYDNYRGL